MNRSVVALLSSLALLGATATAAVAGPPETMNPMGKVRGIVPPRNEAGKGGGSSLLTYHGGPVMHTNTAVPIYWFPVGSQTSTSYKSVIDGYFADVARDHTNSNVYFADTQYSDGLGLIADNSAVGPSIVDTNAFPASGCRDRYTRTCLTDAQLSSEIRRVAAANNLAIDGTKLFFIFTPKDVGSCYGSSCAYSSFCAYHSQDSTGKLIYANQPYAAFVPSACDSGQHPNSDEADATLNVVSHEHNEAITDPLGTAWYDSRGYENGDKCAWKFGTALGGSSGAQYNQVINGSRYYLQQEWSNASTSCVLTGL